MRASALLLVSDPSVTWTAGTVPALALLPSTIAGLWAGHRLWRLEHLIPRAVTGVAVGGAGPARAGTAPLARPARLDRAPRVAHRRAVRRAAAAHPLAALGAEPVGLLAGFGLLALATLLASLLEALGRAHWAVAGVLAVSPWLLARLEAPPAFPGRALDRRGDRGRARAAAARRSRCWPVPRGRWRRRCGSRECGVARPPPLAVASVAVLGTLVLTGVVWSARRSGGAACRGTLDPGLRGAAGDRRPDRRRPGPRLLIINPSNGPGAGSSRRTGARSSARRRAARTCSATWRRTFGARAAAAVEADVARYRDWYGVDGIFLDEVAHDAGQLPYYAALSRRDPGHGRRAARAQPGTVPARGYFALADVVVTYEGPFSDYAPRLAHEPAWVRDVPPAQIAHLVYAATRESRPSLFAAPARRARSTSPRARSPTPGEPARVPRDEEKLYRGVAHEVALGAYCRRRWRLPASCLPAVAFAGPIGSPRASSGSRAGRRRGGVRRRCRGTPPRRQPTRHQARGRTRDRCRPRNGPGPRTPPRRRAFWSRQRRRPPTRRRDAPPASPSTDAARCWSNRGRWRARGGRPARGRARARRCRRRSRSRRRGEGAEPADAVRRARAPHRALRRGVRAAGRRESKRLRDAVRGRIALGAPAAGVVRRRRSVAAVELDRGGHRPPAERPCEPGTGPSAARRAAGRRPSRLRLQPARTALNLLASPPARSPALHRRGVLGHRLRRCSGQRRLIDTSCRRRTAPSAEPSAPAAYRPPAGTRRSVTRDRTRPSPVRGGGHSVWSRQRLPERLPGQLGWWQRRAIAPSSSGRRGR